MLSKLHACAHLAQGQLRSLMPAGSGLQQIAAAGDGLGGIPEHEVHKRG